MTTVLVFAFIRCFPEGPGPVATPQTYAPQTFMVMEMDGMAFWIPM